jgi:hypothetical protein
VGKTASYLHDEGLKCALIATISGATAFLQKSMLSLHFSLPRVLHPNFPSQETATIINANFAVRWTGQAV